MNFLEKSNNLNILLNEKIKNEKNILKDFKSYSISNKEINVMTSSISDLNSSIIDLIIKILKTKKKMKKIFANIITIFL